MVFPSGTTATPGDIRILSLTTFLETFYTHNTAKDFTGVEGYPGRSTKHLSTPNHLAVNLCSRDMVTNHGYRYGKGAGDVRGECDNHAQICYRNE